MPLDPPVTAATLFNDMILRSKSKLHLPKSAWVQIERAPWRPWLCLRGRKRVHGLARPAHLWTSEQGPRGAPLPCRWRHVSARGRRGGRWAKIFVIGADERTRDQRAVGACTTGKILLRNEPISGLF